MSSEKRDFSNFEDFPGSINEGKGIYEFPPLRKIDKMGRTRVWQTFVRLVKDGKRQTGIDWNLLTENQIKIKDSYFETGSDLPSNVIAEIWAENGIEGGKITRNAPTYIDAVAFEGQINQRNPFQQALIRARADYLKREERGGSKNTSGNKTKKGVNVMYFPMLAKPWKDGNKHLVYPLYVQPKLDGVRCLAYLQEKNGGMDKVVIYSRSQKEYPAMEYLKELLYPFLNDLFDEASDPPQSIYLDGEMYKHGERLQDISGRSRNDKKRPTKLKTKETKQQSDNNETKQQSDNIETNFDVLSDLNEYHLYDCFYPLELDTSFESRLEQLNVLKSAVDSYNIGNYQYLPAGTKASDLIKFTPTTLVDDLKSAEKLFTKYTREGYEGIILRNTDGVYLAHPTKTNAALRSNDLVKMKQKFTDEFEVVGYTEGRRGKDKGAIIWICKTTNGYEFNVTPKDITYKKRYELFESAKKHFNSKYKGRMLTVEYEDLSKNGVPQRAKGLVFRDYE